MAIVAVAMSTAIAHGQPGATTSDRLRGANTAALAGDWQRVADFVGPLLQQPLERADLSEAHRLAGLAAFFRQRSNEAENHFLAYLRIEIDARLDPALYPPEVVAFFNDVASRHIAELRALRSQPKRRSWVLTLIPPFGQFQNGDRVKGYVIGGALGGFLIVNVTSYAYLRTWCHHASGTAGDSWICNNGGDHRPEAAKLRPYNIASGIGAILTYAYGVYDAVQGYRQRSREHAILPFTTSSRLSTIVGVTGTF